MENSNNNPKNKSVKQIISDIKDHADMADASYSFYEFIDKNEKWSKSDEFYNYKILKKPNPRWVYADNIKQGFINPETESMTAYALCVEARFMKDKEIKKPLQEGEAEPEKVKIDNNIKNFIYIDHKTNEQELFYKPTSLSHRTKTFVNRYELISHQQNTAISGFSYTIFKDTEPTMSSDKPRYIIAFRGTEVGGAELLKDLVLTDVFIAAFAGLPQIISLFTMIGDIKKAIREDSGSDEKTPNFNVSICGHSLGGHLSQVCCLFYKSLNVDELYTYNAPGIGGLAISALHFVFRVVRLIVKLIKFCVHKLLDLFGFTRKVIDKCVDKIYNGSKSTDTLISECKEHKDELDPNLLEESAASCKTIYKDRIPFEIHHCETIKNTVTCEEFDIGNDFNRAIEPTVSVIADLGYKLGLTPNDRINYKNTPRLHLLHIGQLDGNYYKNSHYMTSIIYAIYLYDYLLKEYKNSKKKALSEDISYALTYLDKLSAILVDNIEGNKYKLSDKNENIKDGNQNYISIILGELYHILESLGDEEYQEIIDKYSAESENKLSKVTLVDMLMDLADKQIYARIIDKNDMDDSSNIPLNQIRSLQKMYPLEFIHNENELIKDKTDITKAYTYGSNLTKCYLPKEKEKDSLFIKAKKAQFKNAMFSDNFTSIYIRDNGAKEKFSLDRSSSTAFADTENKQLYIFLNDKDVVDCDEIYNKIEDRLNIEDIRSYTPNVFLNSMPLNTATEQSDYPLYFKKEEDGEESNSNALSFSHQPRDEEKDKGRLSVSYKNSQASILNYSLLNKSLNIDLKPTNKETKESLEKANKRLNLEKKSSTVSAGGTAFANPIIEDDVVVCPHGGHVILKSRAGKSIRSDDQGVILDVDFINSPIVGCSAKNPCTKVAYVPRAALSLKSMNNHYAVMQDLVPACLSNTSSPLRCIKKENRIKLAHSIGSPTSENDNAAVLNPNLNKPVIRLHVKAFASQSDNLLVATYYLFDKKFEDKNGFSKIKLNLDEGRDVEDKNLKALLADNYDDKRYDIKEFKLRYGADKLNLVFVAPKNFSALDKENYKKANSPESGVGFYASLDEFNSSSTDKNKQTYTNVFLTPTGAKSIELEIAKGLDSGYENDINTTSFTMLVS
ncbi:hypothetical protein [Campylobacter concisus]|uniref:hypothetical protein n=1 Tax=Campylobacter concisus TaxID=199 RepID=UPI000398A7CF|nr:hypothetical protein [Campylobacter concisus]ERJ28490.1 hypothetical protein ATCC51561_943 [Campylobacter concisus ATCC 51561]